VNRAEDASGRLRGDLVGRECGFVARLSSRGAMEGSVAGGTAADAQIKGSKENGQPAQNSEALEMPATLLPRDMDWSEHFSFLNSAGGLRGGARAMTSAGLSNSGSRPDSATQRGFDERVEELTLKNCINADVQPEASAGGSSGTGDTPTVIKGRWGNFTRMAWRTSDVAGRESAPVSSGNIPNSRAADVPRRENLAPSPANNVISQNNDVSSNKDIPAMSCGANVNNEFTMPFINQQCLLSVRPNQSEQRAERENALKESSFPNRLLHQMRSKTVTSSSGVPASPLKSNLKGKGVVYQGAHEEIQVQSNAKARVPLDKIPVIPTSTHDSMAKLGPLLLNGVGNVSKTHGEGASLRELIRPGRQTMSRFEKMNLFKQILGLVDKCHAQGFALQHLCSSYFTITSSGQVKYIGSYTTQGLSNSIRQDIAQEDNQNRKRSFGHKSEHQESNDHGNSMLKYQKVGEQGFIAVRWPIHTFCTGQRDDNQYEVVDPDVLKQGKFGEPYGNNTSCVQRTSGFGNQQSTFEPRILEESWYKSREGLSQSSGAFLSNIYSLGVLLFEV
jgi:protein suppressor of PHYA-105 1